MSVKVERLAIKIKPLAYKSNKEDWIIEGNALYISEKLIEQGMIHKSEAVKFVSVCRECKGWEIAGNKCKTCQGRGIVLKQ